MQAACKQMRERGKHVSKCRIVLRYDAVCLCSSRYGNLATLFPPSLCRYVLMAEADHLFLRPLPNLMAGEAGGAALFTYMVPEQYPDIVRKFTGPISDDEIKMVPK